MIEEFFRKVLASYNQEELISFQAVGGGCINNTVKLVTPSGNFFIKYANEAAFDQFEKESLGLALLHTNCSLSIPRCLAMGIAHQSAYLMLEWVEKGAMNGRFWKNFGQQLAELHRVTQPHFGLDHQNYIGRLRQSNRPHEHWSDFFIKERLEPQLRLAVGNKLVDQSTVNRFKLLYNKLDNLVPVEKPSLLHGDLWSGNFMVGASSTAVLIDPAVYYGHRETELAFTTLFGGFEAEFYRYYDQVFPLEKGFEDRIDLHNLYPLLVHLNLFGTSYLPGIQRTLRRYT